MKVYLIRHGPAVDIGEQGVKTDVARMLSAEGRAKSSTAARGLCRVPEVAIARIVSSPLIRARETAEIFAEALGVKRKVELLPELTAGRSAMALASWLAAQPPTDLALVGHMPDLADLAAAMACSGSSLDIVFKKAAVLCLEFEQRAMPGTGRIVWLLQPDVLRLLAKA